MSEPERDGPPRAVLVAALLIAVAAAVAVVAIAAHRSSAPPVPVAAVRAPHADDQPCKDLLAALPDRLGDYRRTDVAFPVPPGVAAWRAGVGEGDFAALRRALMAARARHAGALGLALPRAIEPAEVRLVWP